ncbi:zinc transport system substrate-binding protein [Paracoccus alcaliphilus]|uniref:Zinc transport system substrate-binding protein n=1 Tax=Paracoccus alcaliphilus TaxID=34002 RepID=A0A1H8LVC6_9RHOB|nr:metallochaperone AztD [Paracoccus alcaliphilus]WCR20611.1 metallochaperone AztD [Paracoccus alcaliphilus]SEO09102.1 zinc transport system substrate-binding protein [Paracoccus alcaliphilus]
MFRKFATSTAIAMILAPVAFAHEGHDHDDDLTHYRVFVGDHDKPLVTAFDLTEPEHRWSFDLAGQAKLFAVAGGAVVAAVQSDDDHVHFISSGIELHDHGDHTDLEVSDPAMLGAPLTGPRPFHLVDHGGKVVINYDKGGYAGIIEASALAGGTIGEANFPQSYPHHGFVAPLGPVWLGTVAADGEGARLGLQQFQADGSAVGDLAPCTGIHGEAFSGAFLAAGCEEGVLTATIAGGAPVFEMLPYPEDFPQDVTTGTLLGSTAIQVFLGNHGADGLVVIDPVDQPHFRRIELPFRRIDFALDPVRPAHGYVLTEDGTLHRIDLLNAEIAASESVTEPYSMDGHWNDPRPRIAMAGDEIVVSDPRAGLVRRISTEDLSEIGTIEVEGQPYNLTVVGGSGLSH